MVDAALHDDEISLGVGLARQLVDHEFPHYAGLSLRKLPQSGSSNVLFRLGDELLVRLPRQPGGGAAIAKEQRWLPTMADALPVSVPDIVAVGTPVQGYSERWSIVRWIDGEVVAACKPFAAPSAERAQLAIQLADLVVALRQIPVPAAAAADPALRWYRGRPLAEFDRATRHNIELCQTIEDLELDLVAALAVWDEAMALPGARKGSADHWYHADLVAENLLLHNGQLAAALDFGCVGVGDPTIDLHGAWELLDAPGRELFRARVGVSDEQWLLGRAWALGIALGAFGYYWGKMPGRMGDRLCMARAVLADAVI